MIELKAINKQFDQHKVLKDINLFIQEGEIFAILGKSGAGKSTLLKTINLLERPDSGEIYIDNEEVTKLDPKNLRTARQKTAMIFQHFNLLESSTVFENIALPMKIQGISEKERDVKIKELIEIVELTDKVDAYPEQLSGGQKQRVAIARALSTSPKILLCDEATSALDTETTESILNLLKKINQLYGITIVLITHQIEVVKSICHRLAIIQLGELVETASLNALPKSSESLARSLLLRDLYPKLPACLKSQLTNVKNNSPLIRIQFEGENATFPFISETSRELNININILQANIDRIDGETYGVLHVEIHTEQKNIDAFIQKAKAHNLTVEILGYVSNPVLCT